MARGTVEDAEGTLVDTEAEIPADVDADDEESADKDKNAREELEALAPGTRVSVMVTMPKELKLILLEKAQEKDFTLARYLREWIAGEVNFELPATTRTRAPKYATEDERKAAQKKKSAERNALISQLLKAYKAGDIDLEALSDDDEDDDE